MRLESLPSIPQQLPRGLAHLADLALETISPTRCAGCERPGEVLCAKCLGSIGKIDPRWACARCGAPFGELVCTECRGESIGLDRCVAAAEFTGILRRVIRVYKDAGERRLASILAELLLDAADRAQTRAPARLGRVLDADAVVFVPVTAAALSRRGFDHMAPIAELVARFARIPLVDALVKHASADQRALGREQRRAAAAGAYEVVEEVADASVLLIDDVITTGSTLGAAADALRAAGAARIGALAVARVW